MMRCKNCGHEDEYHIKNEERIDFGSCFANVEERKFKPYKSCRCKKFEAG